jgi:hypothetical protein
MSNFLRQLSQPVYEYILERYSDGGLIIKGVKRHVDLRQTIITKFIPDSELVALLEKMSLELDNHE